jgi:hypothetical protein
MGKNKGHENIMPFAKVCDEPLSKENLAVKLPSRIDVVVRSLPNRSAWMRRVLVEAAERELDA